MSGSATGGRVAGARRLPPALRPGAPVAPPPPAATPAARRGPVASPVPLFALGAVVLVGSLACAMVIGSGGIGFTELGRVFGAHLGLDVAPLPRLLDSMVWNLRVPRVLMAAVVGAALAICGAVLQAVTRNALADPYLLGVSHGASTGAVLVVVLAVGGGALSVSAGAFAGALGSFALLLALLGRNGLGSVRVVLTGIVIGLLFEAITFLVLMASSDADTTRAIMHWLLGSMASSRWDSLVVTALVGAVGLVVLWLHSTALDAFAFGTDTAASLGIEVRTTRVVLLVATALLTSVVVASVGAIAFVGLIVPHGIRFLVGPLHRVLLPFSALAGAIFLVWTDALARVVFAPREVPVGVFTALVGVPLFLLALRKRGEW
ncbi:FecCD family ABC transporter permease [Saccharothrix xinjiangensis]|uniref:FecCD family ABC transporter permease n=1 Tax=Saccharothrix xinjiangensis TaxID=204798 RepID=A0ABV9YFL2_9PSEU